VLGIRGVHDVELNGSLYDDPQRYLDLSPDLHLAGINSADLFEGCSRSLALLMLPFVKASNRLGLPTEMVVYPQSGHGLTDPVLQKEAAERNLDWFRFWLKGEEDTSLAKAEQYTRWASLGKNEQFKAAARLRSRAPSSSRSN
jgi:hypothetical protein